MTSREQLLELLKTLPIDEVRGALREVEALTGMPFVPGPGWNDCGGPEEKFHVELRVKGAQGVQVLKVVRKHIDQHPTGRTLPPVPTSISRVAEMVNAIAPERPLVLECPWGLAEAQELLQNLTGCGATAEIVRRFV